MPALLRAGHFDSTLALLRDPYGFISRECRRLGSDLFATRLLLGQTICLTGPEAAELFYDPDRFVRHGAMPGRIQKTLTGEDGVQGLDGEAHRARKAMFMSLMTSEYIARLVEQSAEEWRTSARRWMATRGRVVLYDELHGMLTRAVCAWAGVPLPEAEAARRTRQLTVLFDHAGAVGPPYWGSRLARRWANRWVASVVERVRAGEIQPPPGSAAAVVAAYREPNGELLSPQIAAVELLNVLRPTVAISVFITFAAHALHQYPDCRRQLQREDGGKEEGEDNVRCFVQEVRRFYPFFPTAAARVRRDFEWRGYRFAAGTRTLLDLHGTNHDPRTWQEPEAFRPERFRHWDGSPFNFIPQGGGDHFLGHRCAGEWVTVELMKVAVDFLARRLAYDVPGQQDLRITRSRMPALPRSRFVIANVREQAA